MSITKTSPGCKGIGVSTRARNSNTATATNTTTTTINGRRTNKSYTSPVHKSPSVAKTKQTVSINTGITLKTCRSSGSNTDSNNNTGSSSSNGNNGVRRSTRHKPTSIKMVTHDCADDSNRSNSNRSSSISDSSGSPGSSSAETNNADASFPPVLVDLNNSSNSSSNKCSSSSSNSIKRKLGTISTGECADNTCLKNIDGHVKTYLEEDPQEIAYKQFHLNNVPDKLPCREHEYHSVHSFLKGCITSIEGGASGQLQFISGVPGTGKTATVLCCIRHVLKATKFPVKVVKVNCLELAHPNSVFQVMYKQVMGDMRSRSVQKCYEALNSHFDLSDSAKPITVMVVDEIDTIMTKTKSHVYTLFDWPFKKHAKFILIAICNTIDLPDKMPAKCRSRIGSGALTFTPYKKADIETIIRKRLETCRKLQNGLPIFTDKAINYCALRVCNSNGDARLALKICSQALLYTPRGKQVTHAAIATVSVEMGGATNTRNAIWAMTFYQKLFLFCALEGSRESESSGGEPSTLLEMHIKMNGRISTHTQHACKSWSIEDTMAIADTLSSMNIITCEPCVPRAVGQHSNTETRLGFCELAYSRSPLKSGSSKKGGGEVVPTVDEFGGDIAIRMDQDMMRDLQDAFRQDDEMHDLCENLKYLGS